MKKEIKKEIKKVRKEKYLIGTRRDTGIVYDNEKDAIRAAEELALEMIRNPTSDHMKLVWVAKLVGYQEVVVDWTYSK